MISIDNTALQGLLINSLIGDGIDGFWSEIDDLIIIGNKNDDSAIRLDNFIEKNGSLNYELALRLMMNLGTQMLELLNNKYGVLFFSLKDITVVNNNTFLLTNLSNIVIINEENMLVLIESIKMNGFISPEMKTMIERNKEENNKTELTLPFYTYHTASYYSAALLCIHCLEIDTGMNSIYNSKLYYLLRRCMEPVAKNRVFLYI
jgi:hypothetical protein